MKSKTSAMSGLRRQGSPGRASHLGHDTHRASSRRLGSIRGPWSFAATAWLVRHVVWVRRAADAPVVVGRRLLRRVEGREHDRVKILCLFDGVIVHTMRLKPLDSLLEAIGVGELLAG